MKVLLLNGSSNLKGCTYTALEEIAKTLQEEGIDTEIFQMVQSRFVTVLAAAAAVREMAVYFVMTA